MTLCYIYYIYICVCVREYSIRTMHVNFTRDSWQHILLKIHVTYTHMKDIYRITCTCIGIKYLTMLNSLF